MKLYGSYTSPFVRRVRVLALELGEDIQFINAAEEAGQAALRAVSPVWKIPVAELDGELILDSVRISEALLRSRGPGALRPLDGPHRRQEENLIVVADAALEALIKRFYATRDGQDPDSWPQLVKDRDRTRACMRWLETQVEGGSIRGLPGFGRAEIALACALGWMQFRDTYPVHEHPALAAFAALHGARPSMTATAPF